MLSNEKTVFRSSADPLRDGDSAIRIPDEALQELELDVGDSLYLIEDFVGNTRCLVLSKTPEIADRIDELTESWDSGRQGNAEEK
jgi:antitoxin component of MazEF toxin-antitoxin module